MSSGTGMWLSAAREAANLSVSLAFLAVGVTFLVGGLAIEFGTLTMPGPGMFPTLAAAMVTVLAAVETVRALGKLGTRSGAHIAVGHRNSAVAAAMLFAIAAFFEPLGATLSAFVLLLVLAATFTGERSWRPLAFAAGITTLVLVIFERVLEVSLPEGLLRLL